MFTKFTGFIVGLFCLPLASFASINQQLNEKTFLKNLETIKHVFEVTYAPASWKKELFDWDLELQTKQTRREIKQDMAVTDYQKLLKKFFMSTNDYHANIQFYSTALSLLPFRVQKVDQKYLVVTSLELDPKEASIAGIKHQLKQGDEILEMDGRPIDDVIQEIKIKEIGQSGSATDQRLAELALTLRKGASGHEMSAGNAHFKIRRGEEGQVFEVTYPWFNLPEEIVIPMGLTSNRKLDSSDHWLKQYPVLNKKLSVPFYADFVHAQQKLLSATSPCYFKKVLEEEQEEGEDQLFPLGAKHSFLPPLGQVIWKGPADCFFDAYLCLIPSGKKIAYIRIPSFVGEETDVVQLEEMVSYLEKESDALVIDQLNNPGGLLLFKYAIASLLTDRPLYTAKSAMAITQEEVMGGVMLNRFVELIQEEAKLDGSFNTSIVGYRLGLEEFLKIKDYNDFIIQEWSQGKTLTAPIPYLGLDFVKPSPIRYTKPMVILVNELDFSCGDFFPALMQDNQRALIFGTKTAGAGGHIVETYFPNLLGIRGFVTTGSLGYRLNGKPLENLGVTPDVVYEITENDIRHQYQDYLQALHKVLDKL